MVVPCLRGLGLCPSAWGPALGQIRAEVDGRALLTVEAEGLELACEPVRHAHTVKDHGKHPSVLPVGQPTLASQLEDVGVQRGEEV
jgi:hypothetical protein